MLTKTILRTSSLWLESNDRKSEQCTTKNDHNNWNQAVFLTFRLAYKKEGGGGGKAVWNI